ncbi:MAG: hypothetical protein ABIM42_06765 [candidate division WOR-3 bacterium]
MLIGMIGMIGMPGAEEGFKAAIVGILSGLILSILFNEVLRNLGFVVLLWLCYITLPQSYHPWN